MKIISIDRGIFNSNSYIVYDEMTKECMVIDMGVSSNYSSKIIEEKGLKVKYLVLTHGHYDHAHFIEKYISLYPDAKAICHTDEVKILTDPIANVTELAGVSCSYNCDFTLVNNGDVLYLGDLKFEVLNFPGHTPGCICLFNAENKVMFTGDVIFSDGIGRTDFKYGDYTAMINSLNTISKMDKDITIYPGHGNIARLGNAI